jgi:hypothetical protein
LPWRAGAEDKRFELVRGCPQHAFQVSARAFGGDHGRPNLRRRGLPPQASDGPERGRMQLELQLRPDLLRRSGSSGVRLF